MLSEQIIHAINNRILEMGYRTHCWIDIELSKDVVFKASIAIDTDSKLFLEMTDEQVEILCCRYGDILLSDTIQNPNLVANIEKVIVDRRPVQRRPCKRGTPQLRKMLKTHIV